MPTNQPFPNAQLAFILQETTTLEASLVDRVRAHTRGAIADIILCRPEEDGSGGDNSFLDLFRMNPRSEMMSFRSMAQIENAGKNNVMSNNVVGRIAEEAARSEQYMKPIAVFLCDQVYHHAQVRLTEKRFLHSRERLPTEEVEHVPRRHGPCIGKMEETDLTADSSDIDDIRRGHLSH